MAECKPTQKSLPVSQSGLNSISKVLKIILGAFDLPKKPAPIIPPFLLLVGAKLKPGLSGRELAANTISKLESEAGIPMGDIFADGPNAIASAVLVNSKETMSHIRENGSVQSVFGPGSVQVAVAGANAGGPLFATGSNTNPVSTFGNIS
jgi:hypothetical protein